VGRGYIYLVQRLALPSGYSLERDADVIALLRDDGSTVAVFSVRGVDTKEIERDAKEDAANR
jgi:hypothetical protein